MSRSTHLLFVLLCGVAAGCPKPYEAKLQAGEAAARAGRWKDARDAWAEAAKLEPGAALPLARRGLAEWQLGERPAALESWRAAVQLEPAQPLALEGLALGALAATDAGAAVAHLGALDSPQGSLRLTLARALLARGADTDASAALTHLTAALAEAPQDADTLYLLGSAQIVLKKYGDAQGTFEALQRAHPTSPLGSYGLARLAAAQARQTDTLLNLTAAKNVAGSGWNAAQVAADPAFAFLSDNADFKALVGK
ncbi:MAG: tetratricopeptide repeat protein [Myxococcota bacterium]